MKVILYNSLVLLILTVLLCFSSFCGESIAQNDNEASFCSDSNLINYRKAKNEYQNGNYEAALGLFEQSSIRFNEAQDWTYCCHALAYMSQCFRKLDEMKLAEMYLVKAEKMYNTYNISEIDLYLKILYVNSLIFTDKGDYSKSYVILKNAIDLSFESVHRDSVKALLYNAIGRNYTKTGNLDSALYYYEMAVSLKVTNAIEPDFELAVFYNNLGAIHARKGNYLVAVKYINKALHINKKFATSHHKGLAESYYSMGITNFLLGLYDLSFSYYDSAQMIYSSKIGEDYYELYDIYEGKANIYYNQGDMPLAVEYYQNALRILNNSDYIDRSRLSKIKYILGLIYYRQEDFEQAMTYFEDCMFLNKKYNPYLLSNTYHAYAKCLEKSGNPIDADQYYLLTIENRKEFYGENHPSLAYDYLNYGILLYRKNDTLNGIRYLVKANEIYHNAYGIKHPATAEVLYWIGRFYYEQHYWGKAIDYCQHAIIASTGNFKNADPAQNPLLNDIIYETPGLKALKGKAEALFERFLANQGDTSDLVLSLSTFDLASKTIHKIRTFSNLPESKIILTENERDLYIKGMSVALKLYELTNDKRYFEKTLSYASKSKAAILTSSLQEADAKLTGNIPEFYLNTEYELKQKIAAFNKLIYDELQNNTSDSTKLLLWKDELFDFNVEYENHIKEIETRYPDYYQLKYTDNEVSLPEIKKNIRKNEVIIEYVVSNDLIYSFLISKNETTYHVTNIDTSYYKSLDKLLYLLYEKHPAQQTKSDLGMFGESSSYLYRLLISPFEEYLNNNDLVIIPDGRLTYLPFEILISSKPEKNYFFYDLQFLIKNHAIGYAYASSLIKKRIKGAGGKPSIGAFFPIYGLENQNTNSSESNPDREFLHNLRYTEPEKKYLLSVPKSKLFISDQAVESNLISELNNWDILHLSMHGIIDSLNPLYSKLVFSNSGLSHEDNMLHHYEIYNLKTKAKLIVLSACHSGYGSYIKGEGIISLARAFCNAGCPAVVTTLWSVNDESGSEVIIAFYKQLLSGKSKIESLQLAKLDYLDDADPLHSHPHYWAPHIVVGDPAMITNKNWQKSMYLLAGILLILVFYFAFKRIH